MASIKNLKQGIRYIIDDLIAECIFIQDMTLLAGKELDTNPLIDELITLETEYLSRIKHPSGKDAASIKKYYLKLSQDLSASLEEIVAKMNQLSID